MPIRDMLRTHPQVRGETNEALIRCVEACFECAQTCVACADACLAEDMVKDLTHCIRLDLDCADLCLATGRLGARRTGSNAAILQRLVALCAEACAGCATECERHAGMHEHCRLCAESCRRCEAACREAAGSMAPIPQ